MELILICVTKNERTENTCAENEETAFLKLISCSANQTTVHLFLTGKTTARCFVSRVVWFCFIVVVRLVPVLLCYRYCCCKSTDVLVNKEKIEKHNHTHMCWLDHNMTLVALLCFDMVDISLVDSHGHGEGCAHGEKRLHDDEERQEETP